MGSRAGSQHRRRRRLAALVVPIVAAALPVTLATTTLAPAAHAAPSAATVTLTAEADTFVTSTQPDANFGGLDHVDVYGGANPACVLAPAQTYGLLRFDLTTLPRGAVVTGARLTLTSRSGYAQDGDPLHHVLRVGNDWSENGATWNTAPSGFADGSSDPRADALGSDYVWRPNCGSDDSGPQVQRFPGVSEEGVPSTLDAESAFVGAVASARTGDGLLSLEVFDLNCPSGCPAGPNTGYWARYWSREASDPAVRPKLTLSFVSTSVVQAVPSGPKTAVALTLTGQPSTAYTVGVVTSDSCPAGRLVGARPIADAPSDHVVVTTDAAGSASFSGLLDGSARAYVAAYVQDSGNGDHTQTSPCRPIGPDNDTWTRALPIPLSGSGSTSTGQTTGYLSAAGESRWFRFPIQPGGKVTVTLSGMAQDFDLTVFKDIRLAYTDLTTTADLTKLSAEFAPSVFSPSVFSPSVFSPSVFSPDAYSPSVFSPSVFSPSVFSPSVFSPSVFSPSVFSPSVFSPSVFSPSVFSPSVFSPDEFSPSVFSPSVFSADAFASAQTRSLVAMSATPGTGPETVVAQTWNNTGSFFVRVSGRNGAFDLATPFTVSVTRSDVPECAGVHDIGGTPSGRAGGFRTVVVTDSVRLGRLTGIGNEAADRTTLAARLDRLAARDEVRGAVVDVGTDARVAALNAQADAHPSCPYAKNLVAAAIKEIIGAYRSANPTLAYVVLAGGDNVVPFFRYPDESLLGPESDYAPPMADGTPSQASLRLGYVLGQDEYGSRVSISLGSGQFPIPDLPIGRLVETAAEMTGMIDAYLSTGGGVVARPSSSLVTGYDFLADAADAVRGDLAAGTGRAPDSLITPSGVSPTDPRSWTASDLRALLLGSARHDLVFLAGHFSANSALAADFATSLLATELDASTTDFVNAIVFSAGCHSGYNIVDPEAVPGVTATLDWVQAFARKQATLIAGTGYQYGDTDFLEYSERIYAGFSRQLRYGSGPVAVGRALTASKLAYLTQTPDVRGLHRKALLESTLFGLPMLALDLPAGRLPAPSDGSIVDATTAATSDPGATLGLTSGDVRIASPLTRVDVPLANLSGGSLTATYYRGRDGVVTNPAEPALPLVSSDVSVPGKVLRGVGFRGGAYTDERVVPLTGAPTTELRGVHAPFASTSFFPMRLATANYTDALASTGGDTRLLVTPAQHRVDQIGDTTATMRRYQNVDLRLFYSSRLDHPAQAAAPTLSGVDASVDGNDVVVRSSVVGDPSAGIQQVWVTWTGDGPSRWISADMRQCVRTAAQPNLPADCTGTVDSTRWVARLAGLGPAANGLRFVVQAVNGVGLVAVDDAFGSYHRVTPAVPPTPPSPSTLTFVSAPAVASFGNQVTVVVRYGATAGSLAGRLIVVSLGGASRAATTGSDGQVTITLPVSALPGAITLDASYAGAADAGPSSVSRGFTVTKAATRLALSNLTGAPARFTATLTDGRGGPLLGRTVTFALTGQGPLAASGTVAVVPATTDVLGRAVLGPVALPAGVYTLTVRFLGTVAVPGGGSVTLTDPTYSASSASARVAIPGVGALLDALRTRVAGVGPGKALAEKVDEARAAFARNRTDKVCHALDDFAELVRAQSGRKISVTLARSLLADATAIRDLLGCRRRDDDHHHGGGR